jgi:hypothetical protein
VIERAPSFSSNFMDIATSGLHLIHVLPGAALVLLSMASGCAGQPAAVNCPTSPAAPSSSTAPTPVLKPASTALAALAKLEGEWHGTGEGEPGTSTVERSYRWVLGGRFLEVRNRSTYAPQPKNPKGEQHEDTGFVSYDKARKKLVFRQFHVEGFVNHYLLESEAPDSFVFVSEAIENIPPGFRARETLQFVGESQLEESFEIAEPNKDFEVYSKTKLSRSAPIAKD